MPINFPGTTIINNQEIFNNWQSNTATGSYTGTGGQTWNNATRAAATWHQNSTGRPIQIAPGMFTRSFLYIGPSTTSYTEVVNIGADPGESMNGAIVPNTWYFYITKIRTYSELS